MAASMTTLEVLVKARAILVEDGHCAGSAGIAPGRGHPHCVLGCVYETVGIKSRDDCFDDGNSSYLSHPAALALLPHIPTPVTYGAPLDAVWAFSDDNGIGGSLALFDRAIAAERAKLSPAVIHEPSASGRPPSLPLPVAAREGVCHAL